MGEHDIKYNVMNSRIGFWQKANYNVMNSRIGFWQKAEIDLF